MSLKLKGKLIHIGEIETFASGFQKSIMVIETYEKYAQKVPFELHKERCNLILKADMGKEVEVTFDIRGSEYNGKYFPALVAWQVDRGEQLPDFEQKWLAGAIEKIKSGDKTVDFFNEKYTLTMEQFAAMKAAVKKSESVLDLDELPF